MDCLVLIKKKIMLQSLQRGYILKGVVYFAKPYGDFVITALHKILSHGSYDSQMGQSLLSLLKGDWPPNLASKTHQCGRGERYNISSIDFQRHVQ